MTGAAECYNVALAARERTLVMGILNVTPDSFFDDGRFRTAASAVRQGRELARQGADIIDIGGESTRPGAGKVQVLEELRRVVPVVEKLSSEVKIPLSVDTYKAEVARAALDSGASIVNDVTALRGDRRMTRLLADRGVPVVLMHMRGTPGTMQRNPRYADVIGEICMFLKKRAEYAMEHGIAKDKIIIDPGIGFGKRLEDNLEIIRSLKSIRKLGYPVLAGPSRKSFIGTILGLPAGERLEGTLAATTACILNGADIVRVHDVKEGKRAAMIADAISGKALLPGNPILVHGRPGRRY